MVISGRTSDGNKSSSSPGIIIINVTTTTTTTTIGGITGGLIGMSILLVTCESLHVCTVCMWLCEHAVFCVNVFLYAIYKFSFNHSFTTNTAALTEDVYHVL